MMEDAQSEDAQLQQRFPPAWSTPPLWSATRPLSDIREMTEPSLRDFVNRQPPSDTTHAPQSSSHRGRSTTVGRTPSVDKMWDHQHSGSNENSPAHSPGDHSSVYSVSQSNVSRRPSSRTRHQRRSNSLGRVPLVAGPPPRGQGYTIPTRGQSRSPVRDVVSRQEPITSDDSRRAPSRTFVRNCQPNDILEAPTYRHPRVSAELLVAAPLFVGGGGIEGHVKIVVDGPERSRHKRILALSRISVDLLGVEEASEFRRTCFLNLATELIDVHHPPPTTMVEVPSTRMSPLDPFWLLKPSTNNLPFLISLPLDVGPPPFTSKHAKIRYVLCVTVLVKDSGRQYFIRSSTDVAVLSVYDPEKALMSLPSPLTASDEYVRQKTSEIDIIRVTAGLHRQVWVSGTGIFVDVHISNSTRKSIKKLELQLERDILSYKHAAALTLEKSASQSRIFDQNEKTILSRSILKAGVTGWNGIAAYCSETRTCDLDIPRGHATVKCGKYFEVRYFLNVIVSTSHYSVRKPNELDAVFLSSSKVIAVQLPIVLIHMNSLDVVPNSVAQVAAAIEEKRSKHPSSHSPRLSRRPSQSVQGRAFAAPRMQSLDRMRANEEEIQQLSAALDGSPRKYHPQRHPGHDYEPTELPQRQLQPPPHGSNSHQPQVRRVQSNLNGNTSPSKRNPAGQSDSDTDTSHLRLRHVRSTSSSGHGNLSIFPPAPPPSQRTHSSTYRSNAIQAQPSHSGAPRFREAEVEEDLELGGVGRSCDPGSSFMSRLEASRARQQFDFKKKKSTERWLGRAWLEGKRGIGMGGGHGGIGLGSGSNIGSSIGIGIGGVPLTSNTAGGMGARDLERQRQNRRDEREREREREREAGRSGGGWL